MPGRNRNYGPTFGQARRKDTKAVRGFISLDDAVARGMRLVFLTDDRRLVMGKERGRVLRMSAAKLEQNIEAAPLTAGQPRQAEAVMELLSELGLSPQETASLVQHVRESVQRTSATRSNSAGQADRDYLRAHAGISDPSILDDWTLEAEDQLRSRVAVAAAAQFMLDTLSLEEVAELLDEDEAGVSRRVDSGELLAVDSSGRPRFPKWQFRGGSALPGMSSLVNAIESSEMDTVSVGNFMLDPNDELDDLAPVDYLVGGGDPNTVGVLLEDMARW